MDLPQADNLCQFTPVMSPLLLPGQNRLSSIRGALGNSLGDAKIKAWTYGPCRYHRMEVLGALASVLSTLAVTSVLLYEAIRRVIDPFFRANQWERQAPCCTASYTRSLAYILSWITTTLTMAPGSIPGKCASVLSLHYCHSQSPGCLYDSWSAQIRSALSLQEDSASG